jgi:hypothetical protein
LRCSSKNVEVVFSSTFFLSRVLRAEGVWQRGAGAELQKRVQSSPKHPLYVVIKRREDIASLFLEDGIIETFIFFRKLWFKKSYK